ncbi:serine alkaline protease [Alkalibacterium sp. AK22]|uniref:S8 family peptidase n=1 Tax=Alkalibacterium sp. AK22 TaxID=1229520 RepID=UPI000445608F|nr:S8 family peptidase [Alkalibacterium sp. AK22]EXJ23373.1 serine alkaline protease [Alkalibacterium sp. AK22]
MNKKWFVKLNIICLTVLTLSLALPAAAALAVEDEKTENESEEAIEYIDIMVRYKNEVPAEEELDPAFKNIETLSLLPVQLMSVPTSSVKDISLQENVSRITFDHEMTTLETGRSQTSASENWNQEMVGAFDAWDEGVTGENVRVAVLDTGFYDHADISYAGGHSIFDESYSRGADDWTNDHDGHGTHVAGIIGASQHTRAQGIAPGTDLYGVKIYHAEDGNRTRASSLIKGIEWAIEEGMDIISISSGYPEPSVEIREVIREAHRRGIMVVAASGNIPDGSDYKPADYPAAYEEVIAVSSLDQDRYRVHDSVIASENELAAPGRQILGLGNSPDGFSTMSGTSQATPHVAGVAALLMQKYPNESASQIRSRMTQKARDLGEEGRDPLYGYGLVHYLEEELEAPAEEEESSSDNEPDEEETDTEDASDDLGESNTEEDETAEEDDSDPADEPNSDTQTGDADDTARSNEQEDETDTFDTNEEDGTHTETEHNDSADSDEEEPSEDELLQSTVWIRPTDSNGIATIDDDDIAGVADNGVLAISFDSSLAHLQRVSLSSEQTAMLRERNISLLIARIDMEWVIPAANLQAGNALLAFETTEEELEYTETAQSAVIDFYIEQEGQMTTVFPDEMTYRFFTDQPELNNEYLYSWDEQQEEWTLAGDDYSNGGVGGRLTSVETLAVFNAEDLSAAILSGAASDEPEPENTEESDDPAEPVESVEAGDPDVNESSFEGDSGELPFVLAGGAVILASVGGGFYFFGGKPKS